ncbi:cyclin-like protein [Purpureocillium lavendulum]|uniref:Cyclin-like protein n=1 Tax=Purpureocillium lavendulum TaxID=1247861 RepID=A0AB34FYP3_9HYPO|nr:cyclin-like protein [Purpureocillium lavendulum]
MHRGNRTICVAFDGAASKHKLERGQVPHDEVDDDDEMDTYFTYRPLSNLPTPPPTYKDSSSASQSPSSPEDEEHLTARYRGPAIHLVNLIPSAASLATASVPLVQALLTRADLPLETVALAVCILDSLDAKFARAWRLSCPLAPNTLMPVSKRHTLPPTPALYQAAQQQMLHIDSVRPELIILAAIVIAVKFIEDPQRPTHSYCMEWGNGFWSPDQLNTTERCIMEFLHYRIMPLYDEDCLADAMVDMQLAGRQRDSEFASLHQRPRPASPTTRFCPAHSRSKTMIPSTATLGLGLSLTPAETP